MIPLARKPTLAVWKFASCDGCQLSVLDMEEELLDIVGAVDIAFFLEATRKQAPPPYDISFVEGSVTTPGDAQRIVDIRKQSEVLVTIGACATAGGIQALRNFADATEYASQVYASPEYLDVLKTSEPIKKYVDVDYELFGCPIDKNVLLEFASSLLMGKSPRLPSGAVCTECKMNGHPCLSVTQDKPCLGPVTRAGCDALCIGYNRSCFGCFGPKEFANLSSLSQVYQDKNISNEELIRLYRTFNTGAESLAKESTRLTKMEQD